MEPLSIRRFAAFAALCVFTSACGASALAGKRVVPATAKSRIEVSARSVSLKLIGWDKDELLVESAGSDAPEIRISGDELLVRPGEPEEGDLVVHYPAGAQLDARSMSGDVTASGLKGRANVRSVSGSVRVDGAQGALRASSVSGEVHVKGATAGARLHSVSGGVRVEGVAGELRARSVSGAVTVKGATLSSAALKSHSGEVELDGTVSGHVRAQSFSGSVRLVLAQKDFRVSARSRSGSVIVQGVKADTESEGRVRGQVGTGGPDLGLSTFTGNISVRTR